MRVATKYVNLTRGFFSAHGIIDYRIVESLGATEGAPGAGTAELIVDITTTGATLAANGLKVVEDGIILRSQANLVAARGADWGAERSARPRASSSTACAARAGRRFREVRTRLRRRATTRMLAGEPRKRFGVATPFGGPTSSGMLTLHCPPAEVQVLLRSTSFLREIRARTLAWRRITCSRDNPLYASSRRSEPRLSWTPKAAKQRRHHSRPHRAPA